ncbi:bacillithiol biosynthesis cysteine-adding enzyme BshC [Oceanobacillus halotolerans]|uniref:bacillithiol biosynthesis cysteine-adding enzyme BshC n=1 Tax=Oceanobacillus halotolerans TaxID=2663380 RepID=UPI0013DC9476|nr:bacillithiol biosynthesis cysteine-adding enzyme BshC [Oceanobacillus halotolerans]
MQMDPIQLFKQNRFIMDYREQSQAVMEFFHYNPYKTSTYQNRVKDLHKQSYKREALANALYTLNQQWGAPEATKENIERLKDEQSVVVIGGQQAGLLTGPMYTINKIISIIQFSKQQEEVLEIPVIPVFWIAGEDHDYGEINHVYLPDPDESRMQKFSIGQPVYEKRSISHISLDKQQATKWLDTLFKQLEETEFTKTLRTSLQECVEESNTYVDFFARIIHQLFSEEGLVLIDSGNPQVRELEADYFEQIIEKQPQFSKKVSDLTQELKRAGYAISLDVEPTNGHLFYHLDGERILLERNEQGDWVGKQNEVRFTTKELTDIARNNPKVLSNNVVTRPLMQDMLFPSLAFIGGPGEIGYWSVLKPCFEALQLTMPPVVPRLSFTFIDRNIKKAMAKHTISSEKAINYGVKVDKTYWLSSQSNPPLDQLANQVKEAVRDVHRPLRDVAKSIRSDVGELADKNLYYLQRDIEFLEKRIQKALEEKYAHGLREYDAIQLAVHPESGLQERVWNIFHWINQYGTEFIQQLAKESCSFENDHYVIYL